MLTKDLIGLIAEASGLSKKDAEQLLSTTNAIIREKLMAGNAIQLQGLGALEIKERQARVIREAVQTVVFDTLSFWLRQQQDTTHTDTTQTDTTHTDTTHTDTTTLGIHWPLNGDTETLIRVYPNPATSYTAIQTSGTAKLSDATLCDTKGRRIRHHRIDGTKTSLPLEGLPAGIYTLTVRTDKGIRSIPLVKQ